ncbi:hypothetical protein LCGC14_2172760 [marine sediment metagenome]|uniref:Uncharacterized protein n=1 Tax=marine sediment metagenome TaxID=412755 RepID=A0A0F9GKE7_9ZZZZ
MTWLRWQLYRFWVGCKEAECTYYSSRPPHCSVGEWHEIVHRSFLEESARIEARNWRLQRGRPVPADYWWLWEAAGRHPKDLPAELVYWRT